ncbi:MAG: hypothetical protein LBM75_11730 [Myxococcales bacterium]|jgi:hypothetical protein|nr:hypothetical protein [Myxococcales bacterium]
MAATLFFFMTPEDEQVLLRQLETRAFEVYPEIFDADFIPFAASAENQPLLDESACASACYLHLPAAGEAVARVLRRGPNAGRLELDEVASAVFHYERSLIDEDGALRSGRLWAELVAVGDKTRRERKPDLLHVAFEEIRTYFKRRAVHSNPPGFFIGPDAARKAKAGGLTLREAGRKGGRFVPHR